MAKADVCHWCGNKKTNRSRNKYCSRKCYWESKIGLEGYWSGKERPEIAGKNCYRWKGGARKCSCGNKLKNRSSKTKMCRECYLKELKQRKGELHPRWTGGKPICIDCGKQLGGYNSTRCESCMGVQNRGNNNPFVKKGEIKRGCDSHAWKGGVTPINKLIRSQSLYKTWRTAVFERDDYTCRGCGLRGVYLEAHHIKPFAKYPDLRFVVDNGITYCQKCHAEHDERRHI